MLRNHDNAFTGLEAAIVLIAFVVVAAVFSYVVLGAGFFTTQKAQETIYKGVEQSTANMLIKGTIFGFASGANQPITLVDVPLALAPGAPSVDITRMTVVYSNASVGPVTMDYNATVPVPAGKFNATTGTAAATSLGPDTTVYVFIALPSPGAPPNTDMNFELRPSGGGAPVPFTKTVPPYTATVNALR